MTATTRRATTTRKIVGSLGVLGAAAAVAGLGTFGTVTDLGTTPMVSDRSLAGMNSLDPGGVDHLVFSISLPTTADNTFQDKSSTLSLVFTGIQRAAGAR